MKPYSSKWPQVAAFAVILWSSGHAVAQEQQAEHSISYNVAVSSDYRYRGLSQTRLDPAVSGGADYTHNPTGFYAGTWL